MAENSGIEWTTHTWNPWIGCTKVSAACDHCYAEAWDKRFNGQRWGPGAARTRTKTWGNPIKWQKAAKASGTRPRVFTASLADVFDNHKSILPEWRREMWAVIRQCPDLDFLMLTKRPQNIAKMLPRDWFAEPFPYPNVWLGTTVENQTEWDRRWPHLARIPAAIRFISFEPLLGPIAMHGAGRLHWAIIGGESGVNYRPANVDWFRSLRDQCAELDVAFLFKQWEGRNQKRIKAKGRELDGVVHDGYPKRDLPS